MIDASTIGQKGWGMDTGSESNRAEAIDGEVKPDEAVAADQDHQALPRVEVAPDASWAELVIPVDVAPQACTAPFCMSMLQEAGVENTTELMEKVGQAVDRAVAKKCEVRSRIAEATPPTHGTDGHVTWHVDPPETGEVCKISHYDRSAFITVDQGEAVGRVTEPTPGEDGRDVFGQTLPATPGTPVSLHLDESINRDANGKLIAQAQGLLVREDDRAYIQNIMQIDSFVDFSTGHINFKGDVVIQRGIRDCFEVNSGGNIQVQGLIEAAIINCKGDLHALGGFAGRERGTATVGRNLVGRYLNNIQGEVQGDLCADKEIVNCDFTVHGDIKVPQGVVVGGKYIVEGEVQVGALGTRAAITTELVIGAVPRLDGLMQQLTQIVDILQAINNRLCDEQQAIIDQHGDSPAIKERHTELMYELTAAQAPLDKARSVLAKLGQRIATLRTIKLQTEKALHPGVVLNIAGQTYRIHTSVSGPVRIFQDRATGKIVYARNHGAPHPLTDICENTAA